MTIRRKASLIIATVASLALLTALGALSAVMRDAIGQQALASSERVVLEASDLITDDALARSRYTLLLSGTGGIQEYVESGAVPDLSGAEAMMAVLDLDGAVLMTTDGDVIVQMGSVPSDLPAEILQPSSLTTLLVSDGTSVWSVSALPLGEQGVVVGTRTLDAGYLAALSPHEEQLSLHPQRAGVVRVPVAKSLIDSHREGDRLEVTLAVGDADDPLLILSGSTTVDLSAALRRAVVMLAVLLLVLGAGAYLVLMRLLDRSMLRRVSRLAEQVAQGDHADRPRISLEGRDELAALADDIERLLNRLEDAHRSLHRFNDELIAANASKDRVLSVVSHEFRTPLTAILGSAETLNAHLERMSSAQRSEFTQRIVRQVHVLDDLVADLLTMSRIESGQFAVQPETVHLRTLVSSVVQDVAADLEVVVTVPARVYVHVDASHLYRILTNYVTNARKYGAEPIVISAEESGAQVVIEVTDSGAGVPPEFADQLFEAYTQLVDGQRRSAGRGFGLGLSIVRELAQVNGGRVSFRANHPRGSVFGVWLPRGEPTPDEAELAAADA